jgi:protein TonB
VIILTSTNIKLKKTEHKIKVRIVPGQKVQQIVASESPHTKARVDDAKFQSDKNRIYNRETKARNVDKFFQGSRGNRKISLSDLSAYPKGFNPLKKRGGPSKASSTDDFLKNIKTSDHTYLNTTDNKYYGFYQRVKSKLEGFWYRKIREEELSSHQKGRVFGADLITRLKIVLSDKGELINIALISSCGIREFDQAAIESIKEAAPFQNPPRGLVKKGKIFLNWGFVIKT